MSVKTLFRKKSFIIKSAVALAVILIIYLIYNTFFSPTKIALVNFPSYQVSNIILSNDSRFIEVDEVGAENAADLKKYDAILLFGPGLRLTEGQVKNIEAAGQKGSAVYTFVFSSDIINNHNTDSIQQNELDTYYGNRCKDNFKNMLHYVRKEFDKKKLIANHAEKPILIPSDILYYLDDKKYYNTADELTNYLKEKGIYKENAPRIAFISGMTSPLEGNRSYIDSLIVGLENSGYNIYPISASMKRLSLLKEVNPDAVIYLPMGRLGGDNVVEWLKQKNIPLFCPYPVMQSHEEWINDPRGQIGGFLTARIVLAELDGGICPLPISTQNQHSNQHYVFDPEPERVANFIANVDNYMKLKTIPNKDKKIAISYFKGAGQSSLVAAGLEVAPSLYEFLKHLKNQGYNVDGLPETFDSFAQLLSTQGSLFGDYAKGDISEFLRNGNPLWIKKSEYEQWAKAVIAPDKYKEVTDKYGEAPGEFMTVTRDDEPALAVACIRLGNIALFPQPKAALEGDDFKIVHGAEVAPPHSYIAPYIWAQKAFKANAFIHFGTHGSLEFTPGKQTALSHKDWADCLMGAMPHFYYYTISNVGEGIIAKRRLHAALVSYLTPPFMESKTRNQFDELLRTIEKYHSAPENKQKEISLKIKSLVTDMGIHRDLQLDEDLSKPYTTEDISYIENFAEEVSNEKMTGKLYTLGQTYSKEDIISTTIAITADPLAYSMAKLDLLRGKITQKQYENNAFITQKYLNPVKAGILSVLNGSSNNIGQIYSLANLSQDDIQKAEEINKILNPREMSMGSMMSEMSSSSDNKDGASKMKMPANMPKTGKMPDFVKKMIEEEKKSQQIAGSPENNTAPSVSQEDKDFSIAVLEIKKTIHNISNYKNLLEESPVAEVASLLNALDGGYIAPSPGGDAVRNPNTLPTGRNLYSINAEATPSLRAWDNGKMLVDATLSQYQKKHGKYPRKVSYTFWAGEFIESEGATFAQALYMLGVEPIRDRMNRVTDLRLIPSEELGRPRIDIVVQTSGQLRDLAASRLLMVTKAVSMAAKAKDDTYDNYVAQGTIESEKLLVDKGISPQNARDLSTMRVFGGLNGHYGTGIMDLVEKGDAWENSSEIAETYIHNMGAIYGNDKNWGAFTKDLFEVALQQTDVVIQPRQNNTWGALSLDHMYEFMGGVNLAVKNVTGKEPDTYLSDYRNRNKVRMQELKEAIGVESRTTLLNPAFIKEKMKGSSSSAQVFAKTFTNTYAWNVMKPDVIDNEMWNQLYDVYVKDSHNLGVQNFFKEQNPQAMQEITAVMMETARKGMWKATDQQLSDIAKLHTDLVKEFGASGSGFSGSNAKLQDFISQKSSPENAAQYKQELQKMKTSDVSVDSDKSGTVLKKDSMVQAEDGEENSLNGILVVSVILVAFVILLIILRRKRKK